MQNQKTLKRNRAILLPLCIISIITAIAFSNSKLGLAPKILSSGLYTALSIVFLLAPFFLLVFLRPKTIEKIWRGLPESAIELQKSEREILRSLTDRMNPILPLFLGYAAGTSALTGGFTGSSALFGCLIASLAIYTFHNNRA
jgi:hypothetical protein